jgi:hypothetical protein
MTFSDFRAAKPEFMHAGLFRKQIYSFVGFVGVSGVCKLPSGSASISPYYLSSSSCGNFLMNFTSSISFLMGSSFFPSSLLPFSSSKSSFLKGIEFLNCWARF